MSDQRKEYRQLSLLFWGLLVTLISFNIWHVSKHGLWDPPNLIDPLDLDSRAAARYLKFDPSLRPSINGHYDGQWFYMVTYDPLMIGRDIREGYDFPRYRHNRVIYPLLAHVLANGNPIYYPFSLFGLAVAFYVLGGILVYKICEFNNWTNWIILGYLTNTGILFSTFKDMSEPIGIAFTLWGLLLWGRKKYIYSAVVFGVAALTKEIYIVLPVCLYVWEWWKGNISTRQCVLFTACTLLMLLSWMGYVSYRIPDDNSFEAVPIACRSFGIGRFSFPFVAMTQETLYGLIHATTRTIIKLSLSMTIFTVMFVLIVFVDFLRLPTLWNAILLSQGIFLVSTRGEIWNYFASSCRQTALFFIVALFWIADEIKKVQIPSQIT